MISDLAPLAIFVWIWLPGAFEPVVAGRLFRRGRLLGFNYGRSYLARPDAIPLYLPELPLRTGALQPGPGLAMAGCLRDASPDAWGRRIILNRLLGQIAKKTDPGEVDELTYLLQSGSDRAGALDFQTSPVSYVSRDAGAVSLTTLLEAAAMVEAGVPLPPGLDAAMMHGTSIGGARPKALITDAGTAFIAKFSSSTDLYDVVRAEFVAMRLAARVGLRVAPVELRRAAGKDVLLIERFDRIAGQSGWRRKAMVSALTMFGLDEMMARYASYEDLAEIVRHRFLAPAEDLAELFGRLVFNILVGNTDDHARNHAAFWDGSTLALTPAYDICPQPRSGGEASQAMLIAGSDRSSRLSTCLAAAPHFKLSAEAAKGVVERQVRGIVRSWDGVCEEAGLSQAGRNQLWRRQICNPFAFDGAPEQITALMPG